MSLGLVIALTLAAQTTDVLVVESRRSGASKKQAHALVEYVTAELRKGGVRAISMLQEQPFCTGKKVCLIELGKKSKVAALVSVEIVTVLDDSSIRLEAISVDEDGRRLGVAEYAGRVTDFERMNPKVRSLIPLMEEVVNLDKTRVEPVNAVEVVKPVEVVVKPVDVPKVVPVLTPKIETPPQIPLVEIAKPIESKPRVFTWVAGGLALVGAGTGAAFGLMAQDTTGKIKNPTGEGNYENLSKQLSDQSTVANVSFVTAGVAAAAAVVLFFVEGN